MTKMAITAAALLLSAGTALAADNNLSPTTNPSSSGRPSAILSANECQNVWNGALNQSELGYGWLKHAIDLGFKQLKSG